MKHILVLALLAVAQAQFTAKAESGRDRFVAHEWGTFTSVQGADGVLLEWNPFVTAELPKFVYERNRLDNASSRPYAYTGGVKSAFLALQRMETPVIYFYSDKARTVDVSVKFPQGIITEWYPQVLKQKQPSPIVWKDVRILPKGAGAIPAPWSCALPPNILSFTPPSDNSGSHYYAARETDANLLQVTASEADKTKTECEKFLFYRGIGSFATPLKIGLNADGSYLTLQNTGEEPLRHLYVLDARNEKAGYFKVDSIPAGQTTRLKLDDQVAENSPTDVQDQISTAMKQSLEAEGLYPAEASAMVKTWRDSWFGERGLRVFYVLPREWTDRTLPITIEPKPEQLTRVMVGRAEIITPQMEWKLLKQIVRYSEGDSAAQAQAVTELRDSGLGRFADAAVRRLLKSTPSLDFSRAGWGLLDGLKATGSQNQLAARE